MKAEKLDNVKNPGKVSRNLMIEVEGLTKSFGARRALQGIDLEVEHGECVVIFGPNGAGKTTLIKVLATIMKPSAGRVCIGGFSLAENIIDIRQRIGVVTHQTFLYSNLTAYENLKFYSRMYCVPDYNQRIREIVDAVGMTSRLHDRVGTLSRGMQQRLSLARSLLHKPSLMLLDEPETGLDQQSTAILWEIMHHDGQKKRTVLITTHNLERGLEQGDRILIISQGKIVYQSLSYGLDIAGLKETYLDKTGVRP